MGYFRFLLAALVAYSHVPSRYLPINLGVSAVIAFYFLSGYLMQMSYGRFQERSARPVWTFYVDRFFRIFPTYWLAFVLGLVVLTVIGRDWFRWETLAEFVLLPYHLVYMFGSTNVLLPAWSLSAELAFYLLLPVIALFSTRWLVALVLVLGAGQFIVFSIPGDFTALLFAGDLDRCTAVITETFCNRPVADVLGYRWLPFVFVYFALGTLCYRLRTKAGLIVGLFVTANFIYLLIGDGFRFIRNGYVDDALWGVIILLPMAILALDRLRLEGDRLNDLAGRLAYPFFLTHWIARYLVNDWNLGEWRGIAMFAIGLIMALAIMTAQTGIDRLRYRIRGFGRTSKIDPGAGGIERV